jgi:MFS family permease
MISTVVRDQKAPLKAARSDGIEAPRLIEAAPLLVVIAFVGAAFGSMFTFHQPFALQLGAERVSDFFVGFTATAVLVRLTIGSWGDRYGRKRVSAIAAAAYGTSVLATAWLQIEHLWLYGAAFGAAHGVLYPTLNALVVERSGEAARGRAIALYNGSFNAGNALSALAWGRLADDFGYPTVFMAAAVTCYLGVGLLWRSR